MLSKGIKEFKVFLKIKPSLHLSGEKTGEGNIFESQKGES
jgi:hypothetical protein